ncbi:uncharacterized protein LOC131843895 [Achroia grisella]|uniref:uncharacterized protein LOC131843895 n=1 Tax=Achroia grisella TaxID=688607 RepID=UPI0027D29774|nr:uncharacterized protein LOC131843895 [Achroia grisella]
MALVPRFEKKPGTSGISGQLYETKLLTLIFVRAKILSEIESFYLASNINGIGAFDDIMFICHRKEQRVPEIWFIQAKHKENPNKERFSEDLLKSEKDAFSLTKYFESYLTIREKCNIFDELLGCNFIDANYKFVIYTPAKEYFLKKLVIGSSEFTDRNDIIYTSDKGKTFKYDYNEEDINFLTKSTIVSLIRRLSETLVQFFLNNNKNYKNMMSNASIRKYHVFLAQNVFEFLENEFDDHYLVRFRLTFLNDNNKNVITELKLSILNLYTKNIKGHTKESIINKLRELRFKVPKNFGNLDICIRANEQNTKQRLNYLSAKIIQLLKNKNITVHNIVHINDNMLTGSNPILTDGDLKDNEGIGGLIGNLLIIDKDTEMFKFTDTPDLLKENSKRIYNKLILALQKEGLNNLHKFRFEINVTDFPALLLMNKNDKILARDFLNNLLFYTDQAKENEVEKITKLEMTVKRNPYAIYLNLHNYIQKWWMEPKDSNYLTKDCAIYENVSDKSTVCQYTVAINITN